MREGAHQQRIRAVRVALLLREHVAQVPQRRAEARVELERLLEGGDRAAVTCPRRAAPVLRCCTSRPCGSSRRRRPGRRWTRPRRCSRALSASRRPRASLRGRPGGDGRRGPVVRARSPRALPDGCRDAGQRPARRGRGRAAGRGARAASRTPALAPPRCGWPAAGTMPGPQSEVDPVLAVPLRRRSRARRSRAAWAPLLPEEAVVGGEHQHGAAPPRRAAR